jgi:hypothetical protein
METVILMGLVGIGYLANNSNRDEAYPEIHPNINTPSHSTVYDQNNYSESKRVEETLATDIIDKMKTDSTIVDNTQTFNNEHRRGNLNVGERDKYYDKPLKSIDINESNIDTQGKEFVYSQALGGYVSKNSFLTNDQGIASVPYFKGSTPPPINLQENYGLQAHQGGHHALNYGGKREQPQFFESTPDNIYGNYFNGPNSDKNRYIAGTHRTNELPFEQEKIQPIDVKSELNREIDLAIAKTRSIDTLRTLTNPKNTYEGRIIVGKHIDHRGIQGPVDKNRPYRDYKNSPKRNLVSVAAVTGPSQRPEEILPFTNRQFLNRNLLGAAAPQDGKSGEAKRPQVFRGLKQQLKSDTEHNVKSIVPGNKDYNTLGYVAYPNERDVTVERTQTGIAGTYVSSDVNRHAEMNSDTNPTKEIIAQGREPTLSNVKLWVGGDDENVDIKKIESDYMTHHTTGLDKVYQKIPQDFACQLTRDKFELDDAELLLEQINPDLLNPFRENPFTKSLASHSMG